MHVYDQYDPDFANQLAVRMFVRSAPWSLVALDPSLIHSMALYGSCNQSALH